MRTFTTKQDIVYDAEGLPSGIQVTRSTFEDNGTFVSNELLGFHVLSTSQVNAFNAWTCNGIDMTLSPGESEA